MATHDPRVPETLEGFWLLHQMFRVRWTAWRALPKAARAAAAADAVAALVAMDRGPDGRTALTTLLGHKGDLMLLHFRRDFAGLQQAQLDVSRLALFEFLEPTAGFVSVVELGMYEMTALIHRRLADKGLAPATPEFASAFDLEMEEQRRRVEGRLFPEVPPGRHVCFYPMNKRRGEARNWYAIPFEERARMMRDHGVIGRHYAGRVTQIISGSIGFDDWEWGVDLFAEDALIFKKLIYEMRFDEASAWYAEFGPFYVGLRLPPTALPAYLEGSLPDLVPPSPG